MSAQYVIGIDLGTTNCALAYAPLNVERAEPQLLPIPQLTAAGTVESRTLLPSFLYCANDADAKSPALDLPWGKKRDFCVGEMARRQSAELPDRTVLAAKSWLCHNRVDRRQPILPWNAPAEVARVSPVTASQRYLEHLAAAWKQAFPNARLTDQEVVLTVPASFDAAARELTHEAAIAAGLPERFTLLEEPQAAVYAWLADRGDTWRRTISEGDVLLVCDVGGGTTDFTLIEVAGEKGDLVLRRVAVGNHLLVGGDNMDLALAHLAAGRFAEKGVQLDPWQSVSLWHSCRAAKESLLGIDGPATHSLSVLGRGSKLIGKSVSIPLERDAVQHALLDGFLPACALTDRPQRRRASGFQELGLPFEPDPAVTRHLAEFLRTHGPSPDTPARPTRVLFNGGVFKAERLRSQLLSVISSWFPGDAAPTPLEGSPDLDHAVAKGAASYGFSKLRGGVRIRGGAARSYYIGMETAGLAIPGAPRPLRAICVVPMGMEEGTETDVPAAEIGLVVGEPAQFRFFSSSTRKQDHPGTVLDRWTEDELAETDSLEMEIEKVEGVDEPYIPVRLHSKITELGLLELWTIGTSVSGRWKFEFSVREDAAGNAQRSS